MLACAYQASGGNSDQEEVKLLILERERLDKELNRLQLNQLRQQRFREKKKQKDMELQAKLEQVPAENWNALCSPLSLSQGNPASFSSDGNVPKIGPSCNQKISATTRTTTIFQQKSSMTTHHHLMKSAFPPISTASSSMSSPLLTFTSAEWAELERLHPILNACPLIGVESMETNAQQLVLSEMTFLERIQKLISLSSDQTQASQDVSVMVDIRQLFLKDCMKWGPIAARTFIYLMVVCRQHYSDAEKSNIMMTQ